MTMLKIHILLGADILDVVGTINVQLMEAAATYVGGEFGFDHFACLPDDEYQEQFAALAAMDAQACVH